MKLADIRRLDEARMTQAEQDALIATARSIILGGSGIQDRDILVNTYDKDVTLTRHSVQIDPSVKKLPVKFGTVRSFDIGAKYGAKSAEITTLEGCPKLVTDSFTVDTAPKLKSLVGSPAVVGDTYRVETSGIRSLEGLSPVIGHRLTIAHCDELTSLETDSNVKTIEVVGCKKLTSLHNIHEQLPLVENLVFGTEYITHSILGLILMPKLKYVGFRDFDGDLEKLKQHPFNHALFIVDKYIGKGHSALLECQTELLDADLDDFAEV